MKNLNLFSERYKLYHIDKKNCVPSITCKQQELFPFLGSSTKKTPLKASAENITLKQAGALWATA